MCCCILLSYFNLDCVSVLYKLIDMISYLLICLCVSYADMSIQIYGLGVSTILKVTAVKRKLCLMTAVTVCSQLVNEESIHSDSTV